MTFGHAISVECAKNIIIDALDQFDPQLGFHAADILNSDRLNLIEEHAPKTNMMMCRPKGITIADLKERDMYIPDFAEKYGPHFTTQENLKGPAIIDFEYVGTPESVAMLAHELGHAIADDVQQENGRSFKDFSTGEMEEQAYFVQHIVTRYLKDHAAKLNINAEDMGDDVTAMSVDRANQFTAAEISFEKAANEPSATRADMALKALDNKI